MQQICLQVYYIQGSHVKSAQKEFLSHTLKNKVNIFFVFHNNIWKRIKTKENYEASPCLGDMLDSRAVVGLGEHINIKRNESEG